MKRVGWIGAGALTLSEDQRTTLTKRISGRLGGRLRHLEAAIQSPAYFYNEGNGASALRGARPRTAAGLTVTHLGPPRNLQAFTGGLSTTSLAIVVRASHHDGSTTIAARPLCMRCAGCHTDVTALRPSLHNLQIRQISIFL